MTDKVSSDRAEAVLILDSEQAFALLRPRRGKWAGQEWLAKLRCCANPLCPCETVDFYCACDLGGEKYAQEVFRLDLDAQCVFTGDADVRYAAGCEFAEAVVADFSSVEWGELLGFHRETKSKLIRDMDVEKLNGLPFPEEMTEDGELVSFARIFPYAPDFEFELDGERWVVDDEYCVMPECPCHDTVLSFMKPVPSPEGQGPGVFTQCAAIRYDYVKKRIEPALPPPPGHPSLASLVAAVRKAHPSLDEDLVRRHGQLRRVYTKAVQESRVEPVGQSSSKVGRNDPCPCGSGKKYKKCCGSSGGEGLASA